MCDRVIFEDPFMLIYCPDRYETQQMCNEAVDNCLRALKFIPEWFVTSKIPETFHDALFSNDEDFSKFTFLLMKLVLLV